MVEWRRLVSGLRHLQRKISLRIYESPDLCCWIVLIFVWFCQVFVHEIRGRKYHDWFVVLKFALWCDLVHIFLKPWSNRDVNNDEQKVKNCKTHSRFQDLAHKFPIKIEYSLNRFQITHQNRRWLKA